VSTTDSVADDTTRAMPRIECACGFNISGFDEDNNRDAFDEHDCSLTPIDHKRWYQYAFSFWGAVIALVLALLGEDVLNAVFR
jgi:hypothetical protein